jgi:recombination protein RecT
MNENRIALYVEKYRGDFAKVMPDGLSPDRLLRLALTEIRRNPLLADCSEASILGGLLNAASLGLTVGDGLDQAYLVPRRNRKTGTRDAQFQIGYRGLITLARRSGEIVTIDSEVVHDGDIFEWEKGSNAFLRHRSTEMSDKPVSVWSLAKLVGGGEQFVVLSMKEIEKTKAQSDAARSQYSPWNTHFEAMAMKTAIKRLCKLLPMSTERHDPMAGAMKTDFSVRVGAGETERMAPEFMAIVSEGGLPPIDVEPEPEEKPKRRSRAKDAVVEQGTLA